MHSEGHLPQCPFRDLASPAPCQNPQAPRFGKRSHCGMNSALLHVSVRRVPGGVEKVNFPLTEDRQAHLALTWRWIFAAKE